VILVTYFSEAGRTLKVRADAGVVFRAKNRRCFMSCRSCHSEMQNEFPAEMNIHAHGRDGMDRPTVWAFPRVRICLECGFAEFQLKQDELYETRLLTRERPTQNCATA